MIPHSRPTLGAEEKAAIQAVLESGQIAQGERVMEFEKTLCRFTGRRYAVAASSGTAALGLSFLALGISRGDEVILPSYTCVALLNAVKSVGAHPVITDIDLRDFNLSLTGAKERIGRKTKAVVVPHAFGLPALLDQFEELGVPLIEDGTQALGARARARAVGSFGRVSIFSFYATKMIATGEGGMILTDLPRLAARLHDLRDYDKKERYEFRTNSKMTDLEAAMGIEQTKKLPRFIARRRELARRYREAFRDLAIALPFEDPDRESVYYRYVVRIPKKKREFMRRLALSGIEVKEPVFKPLHQYLGLRDSKFPFTVQALKESCSLPLYPSLSDEACDEVCQAVRDSFAGLLPEKVKLVTS